MTEQWITLTSSDGFDCPAFVARPEHAARAAVVVAMEIFGVNAHIQDVCRRLADAGYIAIAPQLFERIERGVDLGYAAADIERGKALKQRAEEEFKDAIASDIQAAIDYAYDVENVAKVGMVGFCWGGLATWRAAQYAESLWAAVCYYGGGMVAENELRDAPKAAVLAHFATHDISTLPEGIAELRKRYGEQVIVYDDYFAPHGFNCDRRTAYDEGAANVAWQRTLAFFRMFMA